MNYKNKYHYQYLEYQYILKLISDYKNINMNRILDFGCGLGKFLDCFSNLGFNVTGVDVNQDYIVNAKNKGYNVFSPDDFFSKSHEPYDIVFLSHLIEHIPPDKLVTLLPNLCKIMSKNGKLIILSPTFGERFYHDFSHIRPYLPQSIRHAFGITGMPISFGEAGLIELVDIYFFKDPYCTRQWRSFYVGNGIKRKFTYLLNNFFKFIWRISGGKIGVTSSWLGVYVLRKI